MYNRYIPQSDGSYRKNRLEEPKPAPPKQEPPPPSPPEPPCRAPLPAMSFLRNLLPKGLDTGDLLVIALLLLMAGDSEKERSSALLTLALYLLM